MARKTKMPRTVRLAAVLGEAQWHSCIGLDSVVYHQQHKKSHLENSVENTQRFMQAGQFNTAKFANEDGPRKGRPGELLIHRSSKALWRVSDDGRRIEPAFGDDIVVVAEDEN